MGTKLRGHEHCSDGEHDSAHRRAVTRDLSACTRTVRERRDGSALVEFHVRTVGGEDSDGGRTVVPPVVGAAVQNGQAVVSERQFVTGDGDRKPLRGEPAGPVGSTGGV